ncbi:hypothetical protein ACO2Q2_13340 [Dyella sp. KRB-257]|uniref:hypothetical protein n=1 Tax=Dyella sp. KRB-257 TaxID=3400915 RepID=UPI003BFFE401
MTPEHEIELFRWAARGDEAAAHFLKAITDAAHAWDDVVDADVPLDRCAIHEAFRALVLVVPANRFYRLHRDSLEPLIQQAAINWLVATDIEREPGGAMHVAYILRSSYIDLVAHVALLTGGPDWARSVCRHVREMNQSETFDDYLTNLDRERAARGEG